MYYLIKDAIQKILKSEGVVGLYRAYGATVASYGPFSAFYFMFYEKLKSNIYTLIQHFWIILSILHLWRV